MDSQNPTCPTVEKDSATVLVAIELSGKSWLVGVQRQSAARPSLHRLAAGDGPGLVKLLGELGAAGVRVVTCYEAGRDGFWLHRLLGEAGIENHVIDPASLRVDRRARRAKTDRIDVCALLRALAAWLRGECQECRMVRVPSEAEEDAKRLHRERQRLINERVAHVNRIKALLALHGIGGFAPLRADRRVRLEALRTARGEALPMLLKEEIERELERLELIMRQIATLESLRDAALSTADPSASKIQSLVRLKAIGAELATVLTREVFYRAFRNRREVGAYVGLDPSPFRSGGMVHEQGIAKAGNPRARTAMIELAWLWLRYQPDSALSRWFRARVGTAGGRIKRIAIVALARKLLVGLWRYLTTGLVPEGAVLKT
jgi:transposase